MDFYDSYKRWPQFEFVRKWSLGSDVKELGANCAWLFDEADDDSSLKTMSRILTNLGEDCNAVKYVAVNIVFAESASVTVEYLDSGIDDVYRARDFYDVLRALLDHATLKLYHPTLKIANMGLDDAAELRWKIIKQFAALDMFIPVIIEGEQENEAIYELFIEGGSMLGRIVNGAVKKGIKGVNKGLDMAEKIVDKVSDIGKSGNPYQSRQNANTGQDYKPSSSKATSGQGTSAQKEEKNSSPNPAETVREPKFTEEEADNIMVILGHLNNIYGKL